LTNTSWTPDADGQTGLYTPTNTDYPKAERTERAVTFRTGGGRIVSVTYPDGTQVQTETYTDGTRASSSDQLGNVTTFTYGAHAEQNGGLWAKTTSPVATQWVKSYSNSVGSNFRIEFADGAMETSIYHPADAAPGSRGKRTSTIPPARVSW